MLSAAEVISQLLHHKPSPMQAIRAEVLEQAGVQLLLKRDDLLAWRQDSPLCGNKWRKLQYNLQATHAQGCTHLLTFGGAYSNHLAAVAEAAHVLNMAAVGVVRGEPTEPLNPTLEFVTSRGMQLVYVSRAQYRQAAQEDWPARLGLPASSVCILPEGGSNALALQGCMALAEEIFIQANPDFVAVACGTGGTLAGLVAGLQGRKARAIGISVLKGDFHRAEVQRLLTETGQAPLAGTFEIHTTYHHGGYARHTPALLDFIRSFRACYGIVLDPIYTGKLMYALFDLVQQGAFPVGSTVVAVHTGGLQGIAGFEQRWGRGAEAV